MKVPAKNITDTARVINTALKMSEKVVLPSTLPRTDSGPALLKGENLNLKLKTFCDQTDKDDGFFRLAMDPQMMPY